MACSSKTKKKGPASTNARTLSEHDSTARYSYDVTIAPSVQQYPLVQDTLRALINSQKESFIETARADSFSTQRPHEWLLTVESHDSTAQFHSFIGKGYTYTGGAHGMPYFVPFNVNRSGNRLIQLRDILVDSTALQPLASYARRAVARHMLSADGSTPTKTEIQAYIERDNFLASGTQPAYNNFTNTLIQSDGLHIIFDAYQVGPYASGTPAVDVPAHVFIEEVQPAYRSWFEEANLD